MTKVEIITSIIGYYEADPSRRAYKGEYGQCVYLTNDGRKCAVGMCLTEEGMDIARFIEGDVDQIPGDLDLMLKPEYQGYSMSFWRDLQLIHDEPRNWTRKGMSDYGKERKQRLLDIG